MGSCAPSSAVFCFLDFLLRLAAQVLAHRIRSWLPTLQPNLKFPNRRVRSRQPSRTRRAAVTASTTQTDDTRDGGESVYIRRLSEAVNNMRQKSSLTDATIMCGSRRFKAHKDVLAKFSPFFESALTKGWKETSSFQIDLPSVSPQSMDAILSYMYTNVLTEKTSDKSAMMKLLQDADYLQMDDLVEVSFRHLSDHHLSTDKFRDMCQFLEEVNNEKCLEGIAAFLANNFGEITKSEEFWNLSANMMKKILTHSNLRKSAMSYVVASALRWIETENDVRSDYLVDFLNILDDWCPDCLTDIINKHKSQSFTSGLGHRLPSLSAYQLKDVKRYSRHRIGVEKLVCFKLLHEDDCQHVVAFYDAENDEWLDRRDIPFKLSRIEAAVVCYGHHVFFFGGEHMTHAKRNPASKIIEYCPFTNTVLNADENVLFPVCRAGAGVLNDIFYIVNGVDVEGRRVKLVQSYDPKSKGCKSVACTNCAHWMPVVFPFKDSVYAIGSLRDEDKFLERYDPIADQWTIVADIPGPYCGCKATNCGSQVFVLKNTPFDGDFDDSHECRFHVYNLRTKLWTEKEFQDGPEEYPWCLLATKVSGNPVIFAVTNDGKMQRYDVESAEWRPPTQPPLATSWFVSYFFAM